MKENRLTVRLQKYWEMLRKDKPLPEITQLDSSAIEDLWPNCFKVSIGNTDAHAYHYEYMGQPVIMLYGEDMTGKMVDNRQTDFPGVVIHRKLDEVAANAQPLLEEGHLVTRKGNVIKYRACFLPFGHVGKLSHIIGGISCRVYS